MAIAAEIFRAYDIRGVVDETLTMDVAFSIGRALGTKVLRLRGDCIVVGRDGRLSGPALVAQLKSGILSTGCNVVDIGVVATPVLYFASRFLQIKSAVMLTGSHNPPNYNGLKIILDETTIYGDAIQELYQMISTTDFNVGVGVESAVDVLQEYTSAVTRSLRPLRNLKIVIDCGNGAAGVVAENLYKALGCKVIPLYCEVDGNFPNHHPDPSDPHNLEVLRATVLRENADLGLAFDGDGDRLGIIDNSGKLIWPDRALMLLAQDVLHNNPGATIIYDVKCSRDVETIITAAGGKPLMWNTGHSLIKAKMRETGALLAAEMSGHIFFKDRWYGFDDALYTGARLIEVLSKQTAAADQVFASFPEAISTPELNVQVTEDTKFAIMHSLLNQANFNEPCTIITIDGMRVEFANGWGLIRPSNTTPKLVLRFEAANSDYLQNIQAQFRQLLLQVDPLLSVPF